MACLGKNHSFNCSCGFGRKAIREDLTEDEDQSSLTNLGSARSRCPRCGARVFYRRGPIGGGTYFDQIGRGWARHPCTDRRYKYSAFNRDGRPKLRNRKTDLQRRGFKPIVVAELLKLVDRTILKGSWFDTPSRFSLAVRGSYTIDINQVIMMMRRPDGAVILNCFLVGHDSSRELQAEWDLEEA